MGKTKANCSTIPTYHHFYRGKITRYGTLYRGTFFKLSNELAAAQKIELQARHGNLVFFISQCEYAPEIKSNLIFISDNNIKEVLQ